ncbi:hypothetical protein HHS34_009990 [Acidithiobacillus montserratensis]|uniref:Uncharacterized protein n=1 Tax=Acidithiobacillus montserratensis TaxID=2729135 RepID=A0ACD5HDS9_9PROT|nr:hypothetical protein [Acidithiobacillus montserratensis]
MLEAWAQSFVDRDGKFVQEFQTTFESSFWELYINAAMAEWGFELDRTKASPDFIVSSPVPFCLEATIASPRAGGKSPINWTAGDLPSDFGLFNSEASLRIANSLSAKLNRYLEYYSGQAHVAGRPFVIGVAPFDRPLSHFAAARPILAALYGLYYDEAMTSRDAEKVMSYNVDAVAKTPEIDVPLSLFCDDSYEEVSAVVYSSLVTWGKLRALADNPDAPTIYTTLHPREGTLEPEIRKARKADYSEHLLDGLYVFHNPCAKHPLPHGLLAHPRLAECWIAPDGELIMEAPDDFLLVRMLNSFHAKPTD